jgi:hypothetical protein
MTDSPHVLIGPQRVNQSLWRAKCSCGWEDSFVPKRAVRVALTNPELDRRAERRLRGAHEKHRLEPA